MRQRIHIAAALLSIAASIGNVPAVARAQASSSFNYPAPPAGTVTTTRDIQFGNSDSAKLLMDVFRPTAAGPAGSPVPALIFFSAGQRGTAFYDGWAQVAASKGLVAIVPDLGSEPERVFPTLLAHLRAHAASYGFDANAMAIYAGSGFVYTALPLVEDPAQTNITAALMFYGGAPVTTFRRDLPVLYVRAGLDRPGLTGAGPLGMISIAGMAIAQNAPFTVLNNSTGHHAFEIADDNETTRDVIDRAIEFVKHATAPSYQAALRAGIPEASAAAHVVTGDFHAAAAEYGPLAAARPNDALVGLAYGEALLGDKQYRAACTQFEKLKGKGLGQRDLGLPAARGCLGAGDPDVAMAWLHTIAKRFLPPSVELDSAFVPLRGRADFRALFQP